MHGDIYLINDRANRPNIPPVTCRLVRERPGRLPLIHTARGTSRAERDMYT